MLRRAIGVIAWLVTFHLLLLYGPPSGLLAALAVGLAVFCWRSGVAAAEAVSEALRKSASSGAGQ